VTRVAAIDCGTNSIRLLIAEPGPDGRLRELERRLEIVRLGQGVDATGEFHPDALRRTFAVVDEYARLIAAAQVPPSAVHFVATSASRDARNREEFFAGVQSRLGVLPDVISGDREAELSFAGALGGVRPAAEPVLVMDIGGGSTELILGSASGELHQAVSLDIGSVRVTERYLKVNPPAPEAVGEAVRHIDELLDSCGLDLAAVAAWIGVAGTATTLGGVYVGLPHYDRARVHGLRLPRAALEDLTARLTRSSVEEIKALPSMHPGRADVVTGGALIAARVAAATDAAEMVISEQDILDGIALDLVRRGRPAMAEVGATRPQRELAVTVVGHDRPGIIADTAAGLARCGMNLEDSSMTLLRGHFAMTLICAGPASAAEVEAALVPLAAGSLAVDVREVPEEPGGVVAGQPYLVTVHGADRLGIVARLAGVLAAVGGNITDLTTRLAGDLYVLVAEVDLPGAVEVETLEHQLGSVAQELGVDVHLRPVERDDL